MGLFDQILEDVGKPYQGSKGFERGTHEVIIGEIEATTKKTKNTDDAAIINVVVFDELDNEKKATCTLWFHTPGGAKMAVTKVLGILVHNVGEDKKDAVRELGKKLFANIDDPAKARDISAKLMTEKLVGKKAYLVAEPQGKYKTTSYGDLWHYEVIPKDDAKTTVDDVTAGGEAVDDSEIPDFGDV